MFVMMLVQLLMGLAGTVMQGLLFGAGFAVAAHLVEKRMSK